MLLSMAISEQQVTATGVLDGTNMVEIGALKQSMGDFILVQTQ